MDYSTKFKDVVFYHAPEGETPRSVGVLIDTGDKTDPKMSMFVLPAGETSMQDVHDVSETYFITKGKGKGFLWINGADQSPLEYEVEPGVSAYVPPGVRHCMENTGSEDLYLVCFFPKSPNPEVSKQLIRRPFPEGWVRTETPCDQWYPKP